MKGVLTYVKKNNVRQPVNADGYLEGAHCRQVHLWVQLCPPAPECPGESALLPPPPSPPSTPTIHRLLFSHPPKTFFRFKFQISYLSEFLPSQRSVMASKEREVPLDYDEVAP